MPVINGQLTSSTIPGAPHWTDFFDVSLSLVAGMGLSTLPSVHAIVSADFAPQDQAQGLIGRDVLGLCVFNYFGPHQAFSLAVP
jgi:hypothetical protein